MECSVSDERFSLKNTLEKGEKWRKSIENEKIPLTREAVSLKMVTICNNKRNRPAPQKRSILLIIGGTSL
jgi:hypothetical protein